jgi:hypothetical protein
MMENFLLGAIYQNYAPPFNIIIPYIVTGWRHIRATHPTRLGGIPAAATTIVPGDGLKAGEGLGLALAAVGGDGTRRALAGGVGLAQLGSAVAGHQLAAAGDGIKAGTGSHDGGKFIAPATAAATAGTVFNTRGGLCCTPNHGNRCHKGTGGQQKADFFESAICHIPHHCRTGNPRLNCIKNEKPF